jgi:hypothetical protein
MFEYGFDQKIVLSFTEWWIKSGNSSRDVKIGDKVNGGIAIRSVDHTIRVTQNGKFEILIEKGAIMSDDNPKRILKDGELYLNKNNGMFHGNGFNESVKKIGRWLEEVASCDPCSINPEKALMARQEFDTIGIGLYIESLNEIGNDLRIFADVVGIPK